MEILKHASQKKLRERQIRHFSQRLGSIHFCVSLRQVPNTIEVNVVQYQMPIVSSCLLSEHATPQASVRVRSATRTATALGSRIGSW
jgi:hypothetical protein